ncbi:MAG TPA: hypothetical protein VKB31_09935 [Trueperaceae bacterium]|nr:hypothetical protein [Trueperaceae bacterium]
MPDVIQKPSHTPFILLVAGLAAVTYLESALLEYPPRWLGSGAGLAAFAVLLAAQALLCLALYRHLRRNAEAYSTFFSRATLVVLATYLALTVLFLFPHGVAFVHNDIGAAAIAVGALA